MQLLGTPVSSSCVSIAEECVAFLKDIDRGSVSSMAENDTPLVRTAWRRLKAENFFSGQHGAGRPASQRTFFNNKILADVFLHLLRGEPSKNTARFHEKNAKNENKQNKQQKWDAGTEKNKILSFSFLIFS